MHVKYLSNHGIYKCTSTVLFAQLLVKICVPYLDAFNARTLLFPYKGIQIAYNYCFF